MLKNKKLCIFLLIYIVIMLIFSIIMPLTSMDESIKLWGSLAIKNGKVLYNDLNILVPPFTYLIASASLFIYESLITIRILNIIVWSIIFYFIHKIIKKYNTSDSVVFIGNLIIILYLILSYSFFYDYNYFCIMFALIIIYYILNKEFNTKNAVIIAICCSLMVLSKHTIGCFFVLATFIGLLYYNKNENKKKLFKNFSIMILIGGLFLALFVIYLIINNSWASFLDLAFCVEGFSNNFMIDKMVIIISVIVITLLLLLYKKNKFKIFTKDNIIILIFFLCSIFLLYPIIDMTHLIGPLIIISLLFYTNKFDINRNNYINILGIVIIFFISVFITNAYELKECKFSNYKIYKTTFVYNNFEKRFEDLETIVNKYGNDVYLIDKYATLYENSLERNMGYYDILINGNSGSKTSLEIIEELLENKKGYILISKNEESGYQWNDNIYKFINNELQYLETIGNWKVYKF